MFTILVSFIFGLLTGWNFLAQPTWAKNMVDKVVAFVKDKFTKKQ